MDGHEGDARLCVCADGGQIVKAAGTDPDKFQELLSFLLRYSLVVLLGLALMVFIIYPLIALPASRA